MESKKFNIFATIMIVVMCVFSIFIGFRDNSGEDGTDGKSAYELAVEKGLFSGTELQYLQSLQGKDGSNITIEDVYKAYLKEKNLTDNQCSLADFISVYYPDTLLDEATEKALMEFSTQQALRTTVDITYSCYMNNSIISATPNTLSTGEAVYVISETTQAAIGISAGSGVIYKINEDTAYIITNYHVVYVSNYSNSDDYRVYYNQTTGEYFTATYDESKVKTATSGYNPFFGSTTSKYLLQSDVTLAPTSTHFVDNYDVYLYGYQSEEYALSAEFVGGSAENDIAILKIDKNASTNNQRIFGEDYKQAVLGDSTKLSIGESVVAVGNPLLANTSGVDTSTITTLQEYVSAYKQTYVDALCLTATGGEVSNISEYQTFKSLIYGGNDAKMRLIRVSSAINAGNSGGGLYDLEGNLIGIVNGKIASSDYDNVGYAIPVNVAVNIADRIIADCEGISGDVSIKVVTAKALGLTLETSKNGNKAPYYDESKLQWINSSSVSVKQLTATGVASLAGIKQGDLINSIKIGETIYELNNDYDFDNILLKVSVPSSSTTITLNVTTKNDSSETEIKDIQITLQSSIFENLI